jgi:hypothetical protein
MKKILLSFAVVLLLSCAGKPLPRYTVSGSVPSTRYDGNSVYLVPAVGDNPSNVDSAVIRDGKFSFEGDTERVSIVRVKPSLRLALQDLLVVTEKGVTTVRLDSSSSSGGTKQNEWLQQWKDVVMQSNRDAASYRIACRNGADAARLRELKARAKASGDREKTLTQRLIRTNRQSTLAKFLSRMTGIR